MFGVFFFHFDPVISAYFTDTDQMLVFLWFRILRKQTPACLQTLNVQLNLSSFCFSFFNQHVQNTEKSCQTAALHPESISVEGNVLSKYKHICI